MPAPEALAVNDALPSAPRLTDPAGPGAGDECARLRREIATRDDILSLAAHELRNPLHALALQLALARTMAQSGEREQAVERIHRAELTLRRYSERVTVLMELLASPGATYPLAPRPVDVPALLETLVDSLEQEARSRGIAMTLDVAGVGMRRVDPVALEQVIDNLLLNAFKHSGGTRIDLRVRGTAGAWTVEVVDNGGGIAPADQAQIFEKFAVARHSSRGTGTGLGLWIASQLVHAMRGAITLASAPGAGSVFAVRIPDHPSDLRERDDMSTAQ
jgi:signal transduction histidine kinase